MLSSGDIPFGRGLMACITGHNISNVRNRRLRRDVRLSEIRRSRISILNIEEKRVLCEIC